MRLLVTRPEADGAPLAALLRAKGHSILLAPLLKVEFLSQQLPSLEDVAALIFTSANGVRAFVAASDRRDLPCYAVGDRTAAALTEAGFREVLSAAGDVDDLARLICAKRAPGPEILLHIAGNDVAGDLAGVLGEAGYRVDRAVLYRTVAQDLDMRAFNALRDGTVDGVLLFSPRTAKAFVGQLEKASLTRSLNGVTAWCLSAAVAHALENLPFSRVAVPETPTQEALLALIDAPAQYAAPNEDEHAGPRSARLKDTEVTSAPPAPEKASKRRHWRVYTTVVVLAIASGAGTARLWIPETWLIEHGWIASPEPPPNGTPPGFGPQASLPMEIPPPVIPPVLPPPGAAAAPVQAIAAPTNDPRIERLAADLATVQRKLAEGNGAAQPDRARLDAIIADQKSLAVSVAALETRISAIERSLHQADAAASTTHALLLAAEQLRQDLASSAPYAGPFAVLNTLGAQDPEIAKLLGPLSSHAATGIPSRVVLGQDLETLAQTLAEPAPLPAGASWWQRLVDRIERLVVIRHIADGAPATPDAIARGAARELDQGDLSGAVTGIASISGAAGAQVAPWLSKARTRLAAESAGDSLVSLLTARLSTPVPLGSAP